MKFLQTALPSIKPNANGRQNRRLALGAVLTLLLSACGGGGDAPISPPAPTVATWRTPQIAPVSSAAVLLVQSDGADGVFVVGSTNGDGLIVQRFSASAGWFGQTVELRGLKNLQAVPLGNGVALFGRDATSWYRRDYTTAGLSSQQVMFPVAFHDSAGTDAVVETFSRAHDAVIVATALLQDTQPLPRVRVQMREYRAGTWSAATLYPVRMPDGTELLSGFSLDGIDIVRSKVGDVARVRHSLLYSYTFIAYRAPTEAAFSAVTPSLCINSRCSPLGKHSPLVLENDGTATTTVSIDNAAQTYEWLAIRGPIPTSLWIAGVETQLITFLPIARFLRSDGTPIWLAKNTGTLAVWENTTRADWSAEAAALVPCMSRICAAISSPVADHIAALQTPVAGVANLYVTDRGGARWSQSTALDASALQTGALAGTSLNIANFFASGNTQIIVGYAQRDATNANPGLVWPFAFSKQ